jgi:hypothetical protein
MTLATLSRITTFVWQQMDRNVSADEIREAVEEAINLYTEGE